jgi:YD repeat-containing protein
LNRLTQKLYPDSTTVDYTYDNDSRLTQVADPTGTYAFTFDNMGRLTNTTTSYALLTGRNFNTAYAYDAASNRTGFTDPESGATAYGYDTLNRLQTLTPPSAYGTGNFGFTYDALSRRTGLTRPNAVSTTLRLRQSFTAAERDACELRHDAGRGQLHRGYRRQSH